MLGEHTGGVANQQVTVNDADVIPDVEAARDGKGMTVGE